MEATMAVRLTRNEIGALGESLAALELERQGLEIIDRNWSCRWGELDVVALDRSDGRRTAVFCEVKCRTGRNFGHPLESITRAKVRRLRQLASEWLSQHSLQVDNVRLDAIGVLLERDQPPALVHITGIGDQ
jgi:putative endonuclease